jgi:hypothetical protein
MKGKLRKAERERIEGKFTYFLRFRRSLERLVSCAKFTEVRAALLRQGYPDWQIFDAATQAIAIHRLDPESPFELASSRDEFRDRAQRFATYMESFYECGDEPMMGCDQWHEVGMIKLIEGLGLAWLLRQHLLTTPGPVSREALYESLREHGFFEAVPPPVGFPYPTA